MHASLGGGLSQAAAPVEHIARNPLETNSPAPVALVLSTPRFPLKLNLELDSRNLISLFQLKIFCDGKLRADRQHDLHSQKSEWMEKGLAQPGNVPTQA